MYTFLPATALTDNLIAFGTIAVPVGAASVFILNLMFRANLTESNTELLEKINGTYLRSSIAAEKFAGIEDKLRVVHHRIDDIRGEHVSTAHSGD